MAYMDRKGRSRFVETFCSFFIPGAESPQAVRKLMALSEPGKARPRKLTSSVSSKSSLHSNTSPVTSPAMNTRRRVTAHQHQQQGPATGNSGGFDSRIVLITTPTFPANRLEAGHIDARRKITNICALPLLLFFWLNTLHWLA